MTNPFQNQTNEIKSEMYKLFNSLKDDYGYTVEKWQVSLLSELKALDAKMSDQARRPSRFQAGADVLDNMVATSFAIKEILGEIETAV